MIMGKIHNSTYFPLLTMTTAAMHLARRTHLCHRANPPLSSPVPLHDTSSPPPSPPTGPVLAAHFRLIGCATPAPVAALRHQRRSWRARGISGAGSGLIAARPAARFNIRALAGDRPREARGPFTLWRREIHSPYRGEIHSTYRREVHSPYGGERSCILACIFVTTNNFNY